MRRLEDVECFDLRLGESDSAQDLDIEVVDIPRVGDDPVAGTIGFVIPPQDRGVGLLHEGWRNPRLRMSLEVLCDSKRVGHIKSVRKGRGPDDESVEILAAKP